MCYMKPVFFVTKLGIEMLAWRGFVRAGHRYPRYPAGCGIYTRVVTVYIKRLVFQ